MTIATLFPKHFPKIIGGLHTERRDYIRPLWSLIRRFPLEDMTPAVEQPSLVSSFQGRIDRLLVTIPDSVFWDADGVVPYQSLLSKLPSRTRFIVVHHQSVEAEVKLLFEGRLTDYVPRSDGDDFTDWAEDPYVGIVDQSDNSEHLLEPYEFRRHSDALIADWTAPQVSDVGVAAAPLMFEGGNCLIGDDFWIVGADEYDKTEALWAEEPSPPDPLDLMAEYMDPNRDIYVVYTDQPLPPVLVSSQEGDKLYLDYAYEGVGDAQPIFHIDMFITLVGRQPDGRFRVLVGSPNMTSVIVPGFVSGPYDLQAAFDDVAAKLAAEDIFDVVRNPLPVLSYEGVTIPFSELESDLEAELTEEEYAPVLGALRGLGPASTTPITTRFWYYATPNNCLVQESAAHGNHVYLPTFANEAFPELADMDDYMENFWQKEGFTVHRLAGCHPLAQRLGVIHCISKYVSRGA